jgi:hypothetical protein
LVLPAAHGQVEIFYDWSWHQGPNLQESADGMIMVSASEYEILACGGFDKAAWVYHKKCYKVMIISPLTSVQGVIILARVDHISINIYSTIKVELI